MESRTTWRFLTIFINLSITSIWLKDHLLKISSHYASSKVIKNPPIFQVCRWSLGGHGGSWQYFSTFVSLIHEPRIIWWKFQVIMPLPPCYLTIRNPPVKKFKSWRTGWILVSTLANQDMSSEYSLKIWSKLDHCGLSLFLFVICLVFSRGGGWFCSWGGGNFGPPLGEFGWWFLKKKFSESEFHKLFIIHCTFLYKILGLRRFWSYPLCINISDHGQ